MKLKSLIPDPRSLIPSHRGSALLIVLGMAAFMMVSAVSFAIYMRESRVPSSHLRRQVAARYLMKAALANAINRIDGHGATERMVWTDENNNDDSTLLIEGIYDDPYPGVGPNTVAKIEGLNRNQLHTAGNHWVDRVFTPFGPVSPGETAPVLTLEALAYLPPAIINEVRLASRKTRTAKWANLSYELGRYAFCAVNVSDCFDLNRLSAANRRTSAAGERINMSSLFRDGGLGDLNARYAAQLDTILDGAGDIPFVSLADFNLFAGSSPFTPFCKYIGSGGSSLYEASDAPALSNALFTVDTWFPPTNRANTAVKYYNLAGQQPFTRVTKDAGLMDVLQETGTFHDDLQKYIGSFGMWALWDYLDSDLRPLSFCIPTTETVPMPVAIALDHKDMIKPLVKVTQELNGKFKPDETDEDGNITKQYKRVARQYALASLADGPCALCGTVAFPFRRAKDKGYPTSFTGDVIVRAWWAPWGIRGRLDENSPVYPAKDDWNPSSAKVANGVVTFTASIPSLGLTIKDNPTTREALGNFQVMVDFSTIPELPMFWYVEDTVIDKKSANPPAPEKYCVMDGLKNGEIFRPYDHGDNNYCLAPPAWWLNLYNNAAADGPKEDNGLIVPEQLSQGAGRVSGDTLNGQKFALHVAAWVRIKQGGDVVDIVPARLSDDKEFGTGEIDEGSAAVLEDLVGGGAPVLEIRGDKDLEFALSAGAKDVLDGQKADAFNSCTAMFCNDPRFNWAPENWFAANIGANVSNLGDEWRKKIEGLLGTDGRDRDIFLFTSDQEYLQSIGELQFLPYLGWRNGDKIEVFRAALDGNFDGLSVYDRRSAGLGPCKDMFWTSYTAEDAYRFDGQMDVVSGSGDFRVNPFSDDVRVLMAALANTPYDYYVASTNANASVNKFASADLNESLKHAFNEKTTLDGKVMMPDEVLWDIADAMHDQFRDKAAEGSSNWEDAFDKLSWYDNQKGDEQKHFLGVELEDGDALYGVDRKFLYSYWRECFQNRQQLFLVFFRAEPLTVGGSSGAALESAQLGARGVALVWRDPAKPSGARVTRDGGGTGSSWYTGGRGVAPHKTRVLFYHQFD